MTPGVIDCDIF